MSSWPFVASMIVLDEASSTNDVARELVLDRSIALPMAVVARSQTRGRGRGSNTWWSDEGSLAVTLVFDPSAHGLTLAHEPRMALALAVALVETIEGFGPLRHRPGIRWPNDVEAGGRKLSGILTERIETPGGPRLLLGVGVNVRTRLELAPASVRGMAVSLHELAVNPASAQPVPDDVLRSLLGRLPSAVERLARDDPSLAARWAELDTLIGVDVQVKLGDRAIAGIGHGIDADGALLVANERGVVRLFGGLVLREP
jgi:BirA family transcriptional regulator, biotin operon repressor / biotin---[acetyl-CoA-carboxylase] ligase